MFVKDMVSLFFFLLQGADGSRQASELENANAVHYGKLFAATATALKRGRALAAATA